MDSIEMRVWMLRKGLTSRGIAKELAVTRVAVNRFIAGDMTSNKVRQYFLVKGCPPNILPVEKPARHRRAGR
jgi:hypothetical protein